MREELRVAFEKKTWEGPNKERPRSGGGSSMQMTARLRANFPRIFEKYGVKTFLDAPCGDWFWMQHVDLSGISYIGGDISDEVVAANQARFSRPGARFLHLDITSDPLPAADLMMCRDCLMHLKTSMKWSFLQNFAVSNIPYLLTTVHHVLLNRVVKENGNFRRFNPMIAPFFFGPPLEMIPETADTLDADILENREAAPDHRSVAIWSREQVLAVLASRGARKGEASDAAANTDEAGA